MHTTAATNRASCSATLQPCALRADQPLRPTIGANTCAGGVGVGTRTRTRTRTHTHTHTRARAHVAMQVNARVCCSSAVGVHDARSFARALLVLPAKLSCTPRGHHLQVRAPTEAVEYANACMCCAVRRALSGSGSPCTRRRRAQRRHTHRQEGRGGQGRAGEGVLGSRTRHTHTLAQVRTLARPPSTLHRAPTGGSGQPPRRRPSCSE